MKDIKRAGKDLSKLTVTGQGADQADKLLNPDIPKGPEEPEAAPVADDAALKISNRRKTAKRRSGGRAGTILTEGSTLG